MARESARDKATRYLAEGRVILVRVDRAAVVGKVRGEGAIHTTWWQAGDWVCDCPHQARTTDCSHIHALRRITAVDLSKES